jgi:hypothetical protein
MLDGSETQHGTAVAALAGGAISGSARKANVVFAANPKNAWPEKILEVLVKVATDAAGIAPNTCVVNMSWGINEVDMISNVYFLIMTRLMQAMEKKYGCVFVTAAGNDGKALAAYPGLSRAHLKGMFIVGAVDKQGHKWAKNTGEKDINAFAAGVEIPVGGYLFTGTSFAAPQVAGLVAYFRANPSWTQGRDPLFMFGGIKRLDRLIMFVGSRLSDVPIIWNAMTGNLACTPIKRDLEGRQIDDGDTCPLPGGDGSGPDGPQGPQAPRVEFRPGVPGPLCTANCGKLCSGFYCVPDPTGTPPDFSSRSTITAAPTFTPPPGEWCLSSTVTTKCNGGPRGAACTTTDECVSYGRPVFSTPTFEIDPPYSPSGGSCISSTTWTERGGPKGSAFIPKSSCAEWSTPTPTPTPEPEPEPEPPRCFTAHLLIATQPLGEDSYKLQIWDGGNPVTCHGKRVETGISDTTVLEYDCDGDEYAAITGNGHDFREYRASDGWTIKPQQKDFQHDTQKIGTAWSSLFEVVYTGGDCTGCPTAELCGYMPYCKDFEGACGS